MTFSALGQWLLSRLVDEPLAGDLIEKYRSGRSGIWFARQVLIAALLGVWHHPARIVAAVVIGWAVLIGYFIVVAPLNRLDTYLLESGFLNSSVLRVLHSATIWLGVTIPFLASGWMVGRLASRTRMLPVLAFALSVSAAIFTALLLDTGQGRTTDWRMWLTIPLFLTTAPATAIVIGGLFGIDQEAA